MSKISKIIIKNYLGVEEVEFVPGKKINIIKGEKGSGKTSIIDAIEKAYTNNDRRPVGIKKGEDEATIYIEQDDGFTIDRRMRNNKSDYLKLQKDGQPVKSTETRIRRFLAGDIFRPLDWIKRDIKFQTESILNMIDIEWDKEKIEKWFGEIPQNGSINYSQHILQVLKDIEKYYFDLRSIINKKKNNANARIEEIERELPDEFDGAKWREIELSELYSELNEIKDSNRTIDQAIEFVENVQNRLDSIELKYGNDIDKIKENYEKVIADFKLDIENFKERKNEKEEQIDELKERYEKKLGYIEKEYEEKLEELQKWKEQQLDTSKKYKIKKEKEIKEEIEVVDFNIKSKNNDIENKKSSMKEKVEMQNEKMKNEKEEVKTKNEKMSKISKEKKIDFISKEKHIKEVEEMKTFVRTWEKKYSLRKEAIEYQIDSDELTNQVAIARQLPSKLLKESYVPIEGISVNEKGEIVINELPIQNLSEGEMKELGMQIAKEQAGELKVICLDGFNALNSKEQKRVLSKIRDDEFQYFLTNTEDGKLDYSERE